MTPPTPPAVTPLLRNNLRAKSSCCRGCGHPLKKHRLYTGMGVNRHGSRLVCIVDNCQLWKDCRA